MDESVEVIEARRLVHLEEQAALYGPHTDPAVLIEIQDLQRRRPHVRRHTSVGSDQETNWRFLMDTVAAALVRLSRVEEALKNDDRIRQWRQLVHDVWMIVITVIVFMILLLQLQAH